MAENPPTIARGDLRGCLAALVDIATQGAENAPNLNRRKRNRRLARSLIQKLAAVILWSVRHD